MMRFLHRHLLLPAFETGVKRRRVFRYWRELEGSQWLSQEDIGALQFGRLRRLLEHAHTHSPYYRKDWEARGLHPHFLKCNADLRRWPVMDRATVREHRPAMRAMDRLISKSTGGSSGEPLQFDLDLDSNDRRTAAWHRGYGWARAAPGTKQLYLWGVTPGAGRGSRVKDRLYQALYRRRVVSCFDMASGFAEAFARTMERDRPDSIVAYVNPLYEVARQLEGSGRQPAHRPRSIVVGAEKLHDFQRSTIERAFGAPVFETYGSREFMLIGAECERHCGLHLTAENLLVEVLDNDGQPTPEGSEGNIVVTDLTNFGMPFVRYATGDRAIAGYSMCPCGRGLPLLRRVVGRGLDMIQGAHGKVIAGEFFPHLVKDFPAVQRFQVVQEASDRVRMSLVTDAMKAEDRASLERLVREAIGRGIQVRFEDVKDIPLTTAGKLRVVVNQTARRAA